MQTLYLIRHTTPAIAPGTCYGQLDVALADTFEQEAREVLRWLPPVDLVIASPLQRALRLGEYLTQEIRCPLLSDARLMEKHFGAWEGMAWDDVPRTELDAWSSDIMSHSPPGGESAQQLEQRARHFLQDLASRPQRQIAIVSHAGSIRTLLALLGNVPLPVLLDVQIGFGAVIGVRR